MATTTTNWGLHKPAQSDHPNQSAADLGTDMDTIDARLATGQPRSGMSNITATRTLGILNHSGAPVAADGTFAVGDSVYDSTAQEWVCSVAGSPGTWLAVGSGKVLGSVRVAADFTMTTAATVEDIPTASVSFTYDGRPVRFVCTPVFASQNQSAVKLITLTVVRSSDNAIQGTTTLTTSATTEGKPIMLDTGPLTAWPSDSVAFVAGTSYTIKLRLLAGASSKASLSGSTTPYTLYVITA